MVSDYQSSIVNNLSTLFEIRSGNNFIIGNKSDDRNYSDWLK